MGCLICPPVGRVWAWALSPFTLARATTAEEPMFAGKTRTPPTACIIMAEDGLDCPPAIGQAAFP